MRLWRGVALCWLLFLSCAAGPLQPILERAQRRVVGSGGAAGGPCGRSGEAPNFFLIRASSNGGRGLQAVEYAVIDSVLYSHPLATVVLLAVGLEDESVFDSYLQEGYCVVAAPLALAWIGETLQAVEPSLNEEQFGRLVSDQRYTLFLLNCLVLALQVLEGGVSLAMNYLLLNPVDTLLPQPLSLESTAMFLEKVSYPEEPAPAVALERSDFENSWAPRSHTDRSDGRTVVCGDHHCPRSLPKGSEMGQRLLRAWLQDFAARGGIGSSRLDEQATLLYKEFAPRVAATHGQPARHAALALPGWAVVEPHFPDGWRRLGHRGQTEEVEDLAHFHSQLFAPRPHREKSDWWLVRSLKLFLPVDYGPATTRNALPRSVVDLARRLLSLGVAPLSPSALCFGACAKGTSEKGPTARSLRTPAAALDALDNPMAESLGIGAGTELAREAALPGDMGGFRTFRDVRVIGRSRCASAAAAIGAGAAGAGGLAPPAPVASVRVVVAFVGAPGELVPRFFCRRGARPEADSPEAAPRGFEAEAFQACQAGLQAAGGFEVRGTPAFVNAALALLAFRPLSRLGRDAVAAAAPGVGAGGAEVRDLRLSSAELDAHFGSLAVKVFEDCPTGAAAEAAAAAELRALLDDVEDQVTVVAHSASRCELLERLGASFRVLYKRLLVLVTCECPADGAKACPADGSLRRSSTTVPFMTVVDVPYDFGLSRGKRLLALLAPTEFILVLDDDFVRSPLSCLECMVWHMRSKFHSLTLPFDLLGFPILEDERNFGAFRGQLRATSGRLFLEPMAGETAADGCTRVGIHPMAFLARTMRFREFRFEDKLQVGEHEQFFYANQYLGLHAAVCFDSTFPHFRVQMSAGYQQRRERMQELMTKEFEKIGFPSVMYLLHKYDALSGPDQDEFISKDVPPWQVSDDTCGPPPDPPTDFTMFFVAVLSSSDAVGASYRQLLRYEPGTANSAWLPRLAQATNARWAFFVPASSPLPRALVQEEEEHGDLVFVPDGTEAERLHFMLSFLRDFQFRWVVVARQDAYVHVDAFFATVGRVEPAHRAFIGSWGAAVGPRTEFFALTRDVHALLASHRLANRLRTDLPAQATLRAWLSLLSVRRVQLPGVYVEAKTCPLDAVVLHPVGLEDYQLLSDAGLQGPPCQVLAAHGGAASA